MECLSPVFMARMTELLNGPAPVIATIAQKAGGFVEEVKRRETRCCGKSLGKTGTGCRAG